MRGTTHQRGNTKGPRAVSYAFTSVSHDEPRVVNCQEQRPRERIEEREWEFSLQAHGWYRG